MWTLNARKKLREASQHRPSTLNISTGVGVYVHEMTPNRSQSTNTDRFQLSTQSRSQTVKSFDVSLYFSLDHPLTESLMAQVNDIIAEEVSPIEPSDDDPIRRLRKRNSIESGLSLA
jgi:hypothetical protein